MALFEFYMTHSLKRCPLECFPLLLGIYNHIHNLHEFPEQMCDQLGWALRWFPQFSTRLKRPSISSLIHFYKRYVVKRCWHGLSPWVRSGWGSVWLLAQMFSWGTKDSPLFSKLCYDKYLMKLLGHFEVLYLEKDEQRWTHLTLVHRRGSDSVELSKLTKHIQLDSLLKEVRKLGSSLDLSFMYGLMMALFEISIDIAPMRSAFSPE